MCFSSMHIVIKFQFSIRIFTVVKLKNKTPILCTYDITGDKFMLSILYGTASSLLSMNGDPFTLITMIK